MNANDGHKLWNKCWYLRVLTMRPTVSTFWLGAGGGGRKYHNNEKPKATQRRTAWTHSGATMLSLTDTRDSSKNGKEKS